VPSRYNRDGDNDDSVVIRKMNRKFKSGDLEQTQERPQKSHNKDPIRTNEKIALQICGELFHAHDKANPKAGDFDC
jgi:hypothetical protein